MKAFLFLFSLLISTQAFAFSTQDFSNNEKRDLELGTEALKQKNYELAREKLTPLAEKGFPWAEYTIGWIYLDGPAESSNVCTGVIWTDRAARHGFALAQLRMANLLNNIYLGIRPNPKKSYGWLLTAINNGITSPENRNVEVEKIVRSLSRSLTRQLTEKEMVEIRQKVTDAHYSITQPADTYVIHLREVHIGDNMVEFPPCED